MDIKSLKKYKQDLLFIPIGGSNEIGLNCNLYCYKGKWLMVDCGIGFTKSVPGVTLMAPDISILNKIKSNLLGLVITHIHEDHLGALQYVWEYLQCPVYTSRFAKTFLKEKLKEHEVCNTMDIIEVNEGDKFDIGPFGIEFIGLTHSTPDMNAILIKTDRGNILHTGDWKFDNHPVVGSKSNISRLKRLGSHHEVLASVCDSTNIFMDGQSYSESDLYKTINNIVKTKQGLVVCTMFASNVGRLKTIVEVAQKNKRDVVLLGSSLFRMVKIAKEMGYLDPKWTFLQESDVRNKNKKNLLVIATGCQGEARAGIDKLANNMSKYIHLSKHDTVIFSSRVIPGNEKDLLFLYNKLSDLDVEIINDKNALIHVSGHYSRNDLIKLYSYIKPKIAVAVHGEPLHLREHQKVAIQCKVPQAIKTKNGMVIRFNGDKAEQLGTLQVSNVAVDGKRLLPLKDEIFKARQRMEDSGAIFVDLLISKKYKLLHSPIINLPGVYNLEEDKVIKEIFVEDITRCYNKAIANLAVTSAKNKNRYASEEIRQAYILQQLKSTIYKICENDFGKRPLVLINFTKMNEAETFTK